MWVSHCALQCSHQTLLKLYKFHGFPHIKGICFIPKCKSEFSHELAHLYVSLQFKHSKRSFRFPPFHFLTQAVLKVLTFPALFQIQLACTNAIVVFMHKTQLPKKRGIWKRKILLYLITFVGSSGFFDIFLHAKPTRVGKTFSLSEKNLTFSENFLEFSEKIKFWGNI